MWGDLFQNFCIMVTLIYAASLLLGREQLRASMPKQRALLLAFSLIPLLLMLFTVQLRPGIYFDLRQVPIVIATLAAGPLVGLAVTIPFALYRLINFSVGSVPSLLSILLIIGTVTLLRRHVGGHELLFRLAPRHWPVVVLMFSLNGLPVAMAPDGLNVLRQFYLPTLLLNVLGFYLAASVLRSRVQLLSSLRQAKFEARTDSLSGAYNRRQFDEDLPLLVPGDVLLLIDIDHFKVVNDRFGHAVGDEVLAEFSRVLSHALRKSDTAYRYGGEEFAVILRGSRREYVPVVAEHLRLKLAQLQLPALAEHRLSASIGVAFRGEEEASETLRRADQALYLAKRSGRNRVEVWAPAPPETGSLPAKAAASTSSPV